MSLVEVKTYTDAGHTYVISVDEEQKVYAKVDGTAEAHGYYFGGTVRFPKGLTVAGQIQMSLDLDCDAEIQKGFIEAKK